MNCYDESSFEDALGQMMYWSLRGDTASAEPSGEVWPRLAQRIEGLGAPCNERGLTRILSILRHAQLLTIGKVLDVWRGLGQIWQALDENTISSEAMWDTQVSSSLRALQLAHEQLLNVWPVFGLMKTPIY